ncbi:hypothetical protein [Streptomyces sp. Je 1-332]|uniref:hypothetical protein n=1 Tax=Streptomyces sp. Je 1-332 TaxID=3231270 RepID=UPI00345A31E5
MRSKEHIKAPQAGADVCPACHEPVTAELTRHKTMGIYVPQWKPGPCHNPSCSKCQEAEKSPPSHTA